MQTRNELLFSIDSGKNRLNESAGNLSPDVIPVFKFCYNGSVPTGSEIDIWTPGGTRVNLTTAERMVVTSSDSLDVTIKGIDGDYNLLTETVSMNGVDPTTTTGLFLSVYSCQIDPLTPSINAGNIDVTSEVSLALQARIDAGEGQTQMCHFVIPAGYTGFLESARLLCSRNDDAIVKFQESLEGNAYITKVPVEISDATPSLAFQANPLKITEKTWIRITGEAKTNSTRISADYRLMLYKNEYLNGV